MARFFIDRPIFAWVLAIVVMALGLLSMLTLPIERYPDIAPPTVGVSATYSGASAKTVEDSVTQVLEQQIRGIDNLLYFSSSSSASGQARLSLTFAQGTDPDTAQVQVQNSINRALNRLPQIVQQQGVTVSKSRGDSLMVIGIYDSNQRMNNVAISDYMVNHIEPVISRINGVGDTSVFGAQYAMRIWLDPQKLNSYALMSSDVRTAIEAQNTQVTAGEVGALPAPADQYLNVNVTALSRLQTPEQFEQIVLKAQHNGAVVYLKDVARVELGAENYQVSTRLNGFPSSGMSVSLATGANALAVAKQIRQEMQQLEQQLPAGLKLAYPRDTTPFVTASIKGVVKTLVEAILLVVAVMFLFLQNWRATIIPAITVPVVLLGTFGILSVLGFSINTLSLFAMVLAIGLLVDDAIVVVENVERIMAEQQLDARAATIESMQEITSALVGITVVLSAVFLPMAFFGGSIGVIYQQFTVTIVSAMVLSVLVALTLTPALCATLLKPATSQPTHKKGFFDWFNRGFERIQHRYQHQVARLINWPKLSMAVFLLIIALVAYLYNSLPSSFLPDEDQGSLNVQFTLKEGAPLSETEKIGTLVSAYFLTQEKQNLNTVMTITGRNFSGVGQNVGQAFVSLQHWDARQGAQNTAAAIIERANQHFKQVTDVRIHVNAPSVVRGLGQSNGFEFWLQDTHNAGREALLAAQQRVVEQAGNNSRLRNVRLSGLEDKTQLHLDIDQAKAAIMGLKQADINSTLNAAWGGVYINDFIDRGRVKRVYMQGDMQARSKPEDIAKWYVRGSDGSMVSFASFTNSRWISNPQLLQRFNGMSSMQINGNVVEGYSSGEAMNAMQQLVNQEKDFGLAWSGLSYQELQTTQQAIWLYIASIVFVFLCLAALYESWSIPSAVMLVIPLGVLGAVLFTRLAGFNHDIYFQVAVLATIGLSTKNAILIVEFAANAQQKGSSVLQAALEGARLRLRPIIMTSLAFVAGVIPLVFSTGAGAVSRQEIGVSIVGGVLFGTVLAVFYVPLFFVLVRRWFDGRAVEQIN
ncbi:multidrug efflux RND transporter permease subunit [Alkanindiges sp. WGS2144]|uniref:multidrug efflux RND transporter permease subunit n=1 Tax=Alkanindiges sp. WGS2144 TaxID=3366808 RepID=UPI003750298F